MAERAVKALMASLAGFAVAAGELQAKGPKQLIAAVVLQAKGPKQPIVAVVLQAEGPRKP